MRIISRISVTLFIIYLHPFWRLYSYYKKPNHLRFKINNNLLILIKIILIKIIFNIIYNLTNIPYFNIY